MNLTDVVIAVVVMVVIFCVQTRMKRKESESIKADLQNCPLQK